jgi:hypothetical protein
MDPDRVLVVVFPAVAAEADFDACEVGGMAKTTQGPTGSLEVWSDYN